MSKLNRNTKAHKSRTLKRTTPRVLRITLIAFAVVAFAAFAYVKLEPHTHDAKIRNQLESKSHQLLETKQKLEAQQTKDAESQKKLEELNKQLQETQKALEAKRSIPKVYAATPAPAAPVAVTRPTGSCADWMAQAGIPLTTATQKLILNESGCRTSARNPSSGACGIPQAYPCSKLPCPLNDSGAVCQLQWMDSYVKNRYGTWDKALATWYSRCGSAQGCWY